MVAIKSQDPVQVREAIRAVRSLRAMLRNGVASFLEPEAFARFKTTWVDRALHGGVPIDRRCGFALRTPQLRGHAVGLLVPDFMTLTRKDLPNSRIALLAFLRGLISANTNASMTDDVAQAIQVAMRNLFSDRRKTAIEDHVDAVWELRDRKDLYAAVVLGDVVSARPLIEAIDDLDERRAVTRIMARQRIVWAAMDVHRVAAIGSHDTTRQLTAWFLRPFVKSGTLNEGLHIIVKTGNRLLALFAAADDAERGWPARDVVRVPGVRGRKNDVLEAIGPAAAPIVALLDTGRRQELRTVRPQISTYIAEDIDQATRVIYDPDRNNQETPFEHWFAGLTPIAALFVVSYRFAEDEAAMIAVLADPDRAAALWSCRKRPFPEGLATPLRIRAQHMVEAGRRSVLRDLAADAARHSAVIGAEQSVANGTRFMSRVAVTAGSTGEKDGLTLREAQSSNLFDLSHHARTGASTARDPVSNEGSMRR